MLSRDTVSGIQSLIHINSKTSTHVIHPEREQEEEEEGKPRQCERRREVQAVVKRVGEVDQTVGCDRFDCEHLSLVLILTALLECMGVVSEPENRNSLAQI